MDLNTVRGAMMRWWSCQTHCLSASSCYAWGRACGSSTGARNPGRSSHCAAPVSPQDPPRRRPVGKRRRRRAIRHAV